MNSSIDQATGPFDNDPRVSQPSFSGGTAASSCQTRLLHHPERVGTSRVFAGRDHRGAPPPSSIQSQGCNAECNYVLISVEY